jgi:hypothetical protein
MLRLSNVATPLTAFTVVVPDSVPPFRIIADSNGDAAVEGGDGKVSMPPPGPIRKGFAVTKLAERVLPLT